jgi:hypothetical protein
MLLWDIGEVKCCCSSVCYAHLQCFAKKSLRRFFVKVTDTCIQIKTKQYVVFLKQSMLCPSRTGADPGEMAPAAPAPSYLYRKHLWNWQWNFENWKTSLKLTVNFNVTPASLSPDPGFTSADTLLAIGVPKWCYGAIAPSWHLRKAPSRAPYLYRKSQGTHDLSSCRSIFIGDSLFP